MLERKEVLLESHSMIDNVEKLAYDLFREWTRKVEYENPEQKIQILDERQLVSDLNDCMQSALISLTKHEKKRKRQRSGYDYGFVVGFIEGNLNFIWVFDYLVKPSQTYKELIVFKSIYTYLKLDELTSIRINAIYDELIKSESNLLFMDQDIVKNEIEKYRISDIMISTDAGDNVLIFLENRIQEQTKKIIEFDRSNYMPNLEIFFTKDVIEKLIFSFESD